MNVNSSQSVWNLPVRSYLTFDSSHKYMINSVNVDTACLRTNNVSLDSRPCLTFCCIPSHLPLEFETIDADTSTQMRRSRGRTLHQPVKHLIQKHHVLITNATNGVHVIVMLSTSFVYWLNIQDFPKTQNKFQKSLLYQRCLCPWQIRCELADDGSTKTKWRLQPFE